MAGCFTDFEGRTKLTESVLVQLMKILLIRASAREQNRRDNQICELKVGNRQQRDSEERFRCPWLSLSLDIVIICCFPENPFTFRWDSNEQSLVLSLSLLRLIIYNHARNTLQTDCKTSWSNDCLGINSCTVVLYIHCIGCVNNCGIPICVSVRWFRRLLCKRFSPIKARNPIMSPLDLPLAVCVCPFILPCAGRAVDVWLSLVSFF